jgi:hypothetical protein
MINSGEASPLKGVLQLDLDKKYVKEVLGLGEIYEIMSIERTRLRLKRKFHEGVLFLATNGKHLKGGISVEELIKFLKEKNFDVIDFGFVDCPPWRSYSLSHNNRGARRKSSLIRHGLLVKAAKSIFRIILCFERCFANSKRAHMVYALTKKPYSLKI